MILIFYLQKCWNCEDYEILLEELKNQMTVANSDKKL